MSNSYPPRKPHLPPPSQDGQPKATANTTYANGALLLRICWLLLGSTFAIVFGFTLLVILLNGRNPRPAAPEGPSIARQEKETTPEADAHQEHELLPIEPKAAADDHHDRLNEVDRVLGGAFHTPRKDPASPLAEPSAPLSSPPLKTPPAIAPQPSPQPPAPPQTLDADGVFEKRLQASEEDLRTKLLAVPELRLFSDLVIQNFREEENNDERIMKGMTREQIEFAYNAQMNKHMLKAGLQEGLPLLSGPHRQLDPETARTVQTLSKDLRDMGFVSIPGARVRVRFHSSGRVANAGATTIRNGSPQEKMEALKEWCDINTIEKFRGALATLLQVLQVEDEPMRLLLVRELAKAQGPEATAALAKRAMVDLSPQVRQAAVAALEKRPPEQYLSVLLKGLRYPWAPAADHAALALRKLKPTGAVPKLLEMLDQPDPSLPAVDQRTKKPLVRELVRLNHMRNCLLCHAPSANDKDGLVRGLVPTPGQPLPPLYYSGQKGNYVRADITSLRQDFSVNLPVVAHAPWPSEQRYDFVTRVRPAKPEEMTGTTAKPDKYAQRDAVLYALRGLTGKDGGEESAKWRELLGIATRK